MKDPVRKVVLAYSGGRTGSILIPWLRQVYACEVIAMVGNVGQEDGVHYLEAEALSAGASQVFVEDLRERFVTKTLWALVSSGTGVSGTYPLGRAITRPVLAERQVELALREGADAVAHGCPEKVNDGLRFERAYKALSPHLKVITPRAVSLSAPKTNLTSDSNLWHTSHEGEAFEDRSQSLMEKFYRLTLSPGFCPEGESEITIDFEKGLPVGLNGHSLPPVQLIEDLNEIAGTNGVGRSEVVEDPISGRITWGIEEIPAGTLISNALRALEALCLDWRTISQKNILGQNYAQCVYEGNWFTPLREALDAFFAKTQERINGSVTLGLRRGSIVVKSRVSRNRAAQPASGGFVPQARGLVVMVG